MLGQAIYIVNETCSSNYVAQYSADDISSASISAVGSIIVAIMSFVGVIALLFIGSWAIKKFKNR